MLQAIGSLIPLVMAMILSSVPFLATVVILMSPRRATTALPYMAGYVLGILLFTGLTGAALRVVPWSVAPGGFFGYFEILIGTALVVLALVQWHRRPGRVLLSPGWLNRLEHFGPVAALGFAILLTLRPKSVLLAAAAGAVIASGEPSVLQALVLLVVYAVLASATVSVPVIMSVIRPDSTMRLLVQAREALERNASVITLVVLLMIGTVIVGDGLTRL